MKTIKPFSIKATLSTGLVVALLGTTVGCTVVGSGYDNQPVYRGGDNSQNNNFHRVSQQLRQDLRRKGYQVIDIRADSYRGDRALTAYAKKNNQAYELKYTYPALRLISSSKKAWPNNWDNNKSQKNNDRYKENKHQDNYQNGQRYKKGDVEDTIKREARYPTIKRRAVNKVRAMGYRVEDIDLEEKNKRGVFEIEAKRGSQKYEILLSYPNLDVIKVRKD
ncbi:hypothetical protein [Psychrobacter sp. JCM 18900]|uniref:hypothetical protein n=1 Tax=Psychrobacter sp. JCM 18900 TaxID=1298608 RepID=UPI0019182F7B|nr:hypothetical protein [Psychrobacter sp. JCM 18900]